MSEKIEIGKCKVVARGSGSLGLAVSSGVATAFDIKPGEIYLVTIERVAQ